MSGVSKLISDELYANVQADLKNCKGGGDVSWKLQAIKSAKEHQLIQVAQIFGVSRVALNEWIAVYKAEGVEGLKLKPGRGRKPILTEDERAEVSKWLEQDNTMTGKAMMEKIKKVFGKEIKKSAANDLMHKLGFSYITPRPKHHKQDPAAQEKFKKKSARKG